MLFQRIKKMSNVLLKKIDKIEVEPNKCTKVRAVNSSCTACVDVCPTNSIDIKMDSLELKDNCINCGICTAVCPTNALKWNHPPLIQLLNQALRLSQKEQVIYITCSSSMNKIETSNVIEVPCLGMIPTEFWISIGLNATNLEVYYDTNWCERCEIAKGESLFLQQYKEAERIMNQSFQLHSNVQNEQHHQEELNHSRRRFLSSLLEEVKETNTITLKETFHADKTLSPFDKFERYYLEHDESEEVIDAVNKMKSNVVENILDDTIIFTDKRAILFNEIKKNSLLKNEIDLFIPKIKESCNLCTACTFLCPTDALYIENGCIILSPTKCVSCRLCEEICYEKHIQITRVKGTEYFKEKLC